MSRDRSLLHLSKLDAFRAFCETQGWTNVPVKGTYERLRMTKEGCDPLIVYAKNGAKEHCTVYGTGLHLARDFIKRQRVQKADRNKDSKPA